jgi:hypothetical protein
MAQDDENLETLAVREASLQDRIPFLLFFFVCAIGMTILFVVLSVNTWNYFDEHNEVGASFYLGYVIVTPIMVWFYILAFRLLGFGAQSHLLPRFLISPAAFYFYGAMLLILNIFAFWTIDTFDYSWKQFKNRMILFALPFISFYIARLRSRL